MRYPQARWLSPQRAYVSQVGVVAAKAIARANGMTASQEAAQGSAWRVETNRPVADPAALMTASDRPVSNKRRRARLGLNIP